MQGFFQKVPKRPTKVPKIGKKVPSIERFAVSRMRNYFNLNFLHIWQDFFIFRTLFHLVTPDQL